jgi:hypothetical protein
MKKNLILLLFCTISLYVAKSQVTIKGEVRNDSSELISNATVLLKALPDSALVKSTLTDSSGLFILEKVKAGNYIISVSSIGYVTYKSLPFSPDTTQDPYSWPVIKLKKGTGMLSRVVVTATKPFVEQAVDRTIINVDALISNTGINALEVLAKSPGVIVDESGSISLKGKSGVLILIDDRPTYLSTADLANYLRALPSSSIDKIELMSNPPARYDANAAAGVINIKTKKIKAQGFNGVAALGAGLAVYDRINPSLNLNFRTEKYNAFANVGYSGQHSYRRLEIDRLYFQQDGSLNSTFEQVSFFRPRRKSPNIKAGIDYYVSPKITLGVVYTGAFSHTTDSRPSTNALYNKDHQLDSLVIAENSIKDKFTSNGFNLNYSQQLRRKGALLTADLDNIQYTSSSNRFFLNTIYKADNTIKDIEQLRAELPAEINIYSAKTDYYQPFEKGAKLEAGYKSSFVSADNISNFFIIDAGVPVIDNEKTNRFKYTENINAAYISFTTRQYNRITFKAGLRLENTNGNGHQLGNAIKPDSTFTRSYTNLFPTAFISYKLDSSGRNYINIAYGKRITRPYYQDLNPFIFPLDKFTYFSGNPYLKPQISHNIELSYHYKGNFTTSLLYNYAKDLHQEVISQAGDIFISSTGNIGKRIFMGISVNANFQPIKGWTSNIYTELINNSYKGMVASTVFETAATYWYINTNNQFVFTKGWSAELSGNYITQSTTSQFNKKYNWQTNIGLQKKIWKNKGSVRLTFRDIFNSNQPRGQITNISNSVAYYHNYLDTRSVGIGLSYSFGKVLKGKNRRNTNSAEDEQNRIKE